MWPTFSEAFVFFQSNITFTWSGWTDDLSGLALYEYEVYEMKILHTSFHESLLVQNGTVELSATSLNKLFYITKMLKRYQ